MKNKIKINLEDLIIAMENHGYSTEYYLDLSTGNIIYFTEDFFEKDLDGISRNDIEDNPDNFLSIEQVESHEGFKIMENFIAALSDEEIKEKLDTAISRRRPFRNFKETLYSYPKIREKWFVFYNNEMEKIAAGWLKYNDVEYEFI